MKDFFSASRQNKDQKEQKKTERKAFWLPFKKYWLLYTVLIGTAILSAFAGLYIGLAPDKNGAVNFVDGIDVFRRVFFSLFYMIFFVTTAEGATLFWEGKLVYHDVNREGEKNETQVTTAKAALIVSLITIVGTGLASARFLSAWLGALTDYETVPVGAQAWVVWSIPILFVFHAVCAIVYWYNSAESELDRWKSQVRRQTQAEMAEIEAKTWGDEYKRVAPALAIAKGLSLARQAAAEDFYNKEVVAGKDLDGDGYIGDPSAKMLPPAKKTPGYSPGYGAPIGGWGEKEDAKFNLPMEPQSFEDEAVVVEEQPEPPKPDESTSF